MRGLSNHPRKAPAFTDANFRVPPHLTSLLSETILTEPSDGSAVVYLQQELMRKFVSKDTDPAEVRRERAINKWLAQETVNAETNDRLREMHEEYNILPRVTWRRFRTFTQSVIERLIGALPPDDAFIGAYSGGASTSRRRTEGHPARKYTGQAHSTRSAWDIYAGVTLPQCPGLTRHLLYQGGEGFILKGYDGPKDIVTLTIVDGNEMFTVPKDATIDRVACKEPDINMYLQKGLGSYIRRQLRRVGIDLNDQSKNQKLARQGSFDGSLATVDLSSASDSVTTELVWQLLPPLWASALDALRSPVTRVNGEVHVNEMFSSMGNGFTFELESLIFWALARAVLYFEGISGTVSVYGDDIILPSAAYSSLEWVFSVLGFKVNPKKSYSTGPFRESCGGHYNNGDDITPFYMLKPIARLTDLIQMCNKLRKWSEVTGNSGVLNPLFEDLWKDLSRYVPKQLWGGHDYNSIYQLVSPHKARKRLVEVQGPKAPTGTGGLCHWLNITFRRLTESEGVETSFESRTIGKCRTRSVGDSDRRSIWEFPFEIMPGSGAP